MPLLHIQVVIPQTVVDDLQGLAVGGEHQDPRHLLPCLSPYRLTQAQEVVQPDPLERTPQLLWVVVSEERREEVHVKLLLFQLLIGFELLRHLLADRCLHYDVLPDFVISGITSPSLIRYQFGQFSNVTQRL